MQKRFIEYDLPLAEISEQSAREKSIRHGHPSTLHIWWARRPLASSRATTFAALMADPGEEHPEKRQELMDLIEQITPWEAVKDGNSPAINRAQELIAEQYGGRPPKVLDPFAGGGSIPLEALRLGCETYASDYNPVAVFIEKATLEWPQKFGIEVELPEDADDAGLGLSGKKVNLLAYLVEKWANIILEEAREEIGQFYPTESGAGLVGKRDIDPNQDGWTPVGYLWARTIPCQNPTCNATIPLIKQFWLCNKKNKKIAYRPVVDRESEAVDFELLEGEELKKAMDAGFNPKDGTVSYANASCPVCGQVTKAKQTRNLGRQGQMCERMIAVILHHPDETGKKYRLATDADRKTFKEAEAYLEKKITDWPYLESPLPEEEISTYEPSRVAPPLYGMKKWKDLYNYRQQLVLSTILECIKGVSEGIFEDIDDLTTMTQPEIDIKMVAAAVKGYLSIVLTRQADYCTNLCSWHNTGEKLNHTFGRQALPMGWDYVELNPLSGSGGDYLSQLEWVLRYIDNNSWNILTEASAERVSANKLPHEDRTLDAVITDPPYYDNVPYAALSDFFYVWWKRSMDTYFPELFPTPIVAKSDEIVHDRPNDKSDSVKTKEHFEKKLGETFQEMRRVLKPDGIAVIVYAHKTTEGWETMLNGLVDAGFVITGSWPIHTEMKSRLVAAQTAALASSIYMVCRKTERESLGFWNDIQPQIKARVEEKLEQFWAADVIRGGDFFISAIGPGMEAYSRYERVETYDGEEVTVLDLLQYIRSVATDFLVHRLLKNASTGAVDKESQFYLTYRWTFQNEKVEYDDARKIASAEGLDIDQLATQDSFIKKTRKYVYVHGPKDRDAIKQVHNMVDALHLACRLWEQGKKSIIGPRLAQYGYNQSAAFWQLAQAVAECLPAKNKEKRLLEGLLMGKSEYQQAEAAGSDASPGGQAQLNFDDA